MSYTFWLIQLHIDVGNFSLTGRWSPHLTIFWWHECRHKVMCVLAFWMQVEQVWRSQTSLEVCSATANMCIVGWWLYTICTMKLFVQYYDARIFRDTLRSGKFCPVLQFKQILEIKLGNLILFIKTLINTLCFWSQIYQWGAIWLCMTMCDNRLDGFAGTATSGLPGPLLKY